MADVEKLERSLPNRFFNALKFTPAGGRISFGAFREGGTNMHSGEGWGVGISEENLAHLFSPASGGGCFFPASVSGYGNRARLG